jgi:hypothetical protein
MQKYCTDMEAVPAELTVENAEGKIFIAGSTQSVGYPVTEGAFSTFMIEKVEASTLNNQDVFISKLSADFSNILSI